MPWTNPQKAMAARACREAGISEEHRKLLLMQIPNARFDRAGKRIEGASATSKRLNNSDFEYHMAQIEGCACGQVKVGGRAHGHGQWERKAGSDLSRMRRMVDAMLDELDRRVTSWSPDQLAGHLHNMTGGRFSALDELGYPEMHKAIDLVADLGKRYGLDLRRLVVQASRAERDRYAGGRC